ncbi:MAG: ankyrin repeat domain-containing protein [Candidatus Saccharibacteria bacterium]
MKVTFFNKQPKPPWEITYCSKCVTDIVIRADDEEFKTSAVEVVPEVFILDYNTAHKYVSGYRHGTAFFRNGKEGPIVEVIGSSPELGLTTVRIFYEPGWSFAAKLGDSDQIAKGQQVMIIGPNDIYYSRTVTGVKKQGNGNYILVDSTIPKAAIGFGVFDKQQKLIGIVSNSGDEEEPTIIPINRTNWLYGIAEKNGYSKQQQTAMQNLMQASSRGDRDTVLKILNSGISPDIKDKQGQTALMYAIVKNRVEIVDILLARKADPNARVNDGSTPLMYAAQQGYDHLITKLLSRGARINDCNNGGSNALSTAIFGGHYSTVDLLLRSGASDLNGALSCAAVNRSAYSPAMIRLLIEHGADPNFRGDLGDTPLFSAVVDERRQNINMLLKCGANPKSVGSVDGDTPLEFAQRTSKPADIVDSLRRMKKDH